MADQGKKHTSPNDALPVLTIHLNPPGWNVPYRDRVVLLPNTVDWPNRLNSLQTEDLKRYKPYFGYGSNFWFDQMRHRCPSSIFISVAVLEGWKWLINTNGYATIAQSSGDVVYGFVYLLTKSDEEALDCYEVNYEKYHLPTDIGPGLTHRLQDLLPDSLVYVDTNSTLGQSAEEYIPRINAGMIDALAKGVPAWYIDQYIRPFIHLGPPADLSAMFRVKSVVSIGSAETPQRVVIVGETDGRAEERNELL